MRVGDHLMSDSDEPTELWVCTDISNGYVPGEVRRQATHFTPQESSVSLSPGGQAASPGSNRSLSRSVAPENSTGVAMSPSPRVAIGNLVYGVHNHTSSPVTLLAGEDPSHLSVANMRKSPLWELFVGPHTRRELRTDCKQLHVLAAVPGGDTGWRVFWEKRSFSHAPGMCINILPKHITASDNPTDHGVTTPLFHRMARCYTPVEIWSASHKKYFPGHVIGLALGPGVDGKGAQYVAGSLYVQYTFDGSVMTKVVPPGSIEATLRQTQP
mmetsp:Transcript_30907/g.80141  ORF Transcript_30907/g.80141 Transcript_30907/m.80141 type:complete len:270 (+) Transcript_30907:3-812(+)